ncbi:ABC transporter permease [Pseudanabaena sp. FACHB-1998]|uniref:ABC transporter permease n=1 Tax=Pseudanabaena sp. FACHB-1998 TaxID=2692858 RepID=UPI0032201564
MAAESLWNNRLRTALTMLGVIIGIAAVIAITSVGQGIQKATETQLQALGTNSINVLTGSARIGGINQGGGSASALTLEDAQAVAKAPAVKLVSPYLQRTRQVAYGGQNTSTSVIGTDINYSPIRNTFPNEGRYFEQADIDNAKSVIVLGAKVRSDLFGGENALGERVRIQGEQYQVIGVMEPKGSAGGFDQDDRVYIPLKNMSARQVGNNALQGISVSGFWVQALDESEIEAAQFQLTNLLRLRHKIYPPQPDDFRIVNQTDIVSAFTNIVGLLTLMVGAIAAISLIVGGIGIANIMLVSVVERTREIGVRKALGATRAAILNQFLTEAILVSGLGGIVGIGLGVAIAYGSATIFQFPFLISIWAVLAGFGLSMIVGLVAGVIPARSAAKLDPIQALRSD